MKSKLKIELNGFYGPMIVASVSTSREDLRDDVMNRFFQSLEGSFTEPDNSREKSMLCFVDGFGKECGPDSYIYTVEPIIPGEEDKFINRLQLSQAIRLIPLAFQMFGKDDRKKIINDLIKLDNALILSSEKVESSPTTL